MSKLNPRREQVQAFMAAAADPGPFVMINLLKFKTTTERGEPGEAVYARYLKNATPHVEAVGGRALWYGDAHEVFIGEAEDGWDRALLVQYPSRAAFLQMISDPAYQAISGDREAALERAVLLVSPPVRR